MLTQARYYDFNEAEYTRRLGAGRSGWDAGAYDDFFMRPVVARSLGRLVFGGQGRRALDLGCGTGALSCQLAEAGFAVTGVDISPSAIAFAREVAARRHLPIVFEVGDVLDCRPATPTYDLIVDGHLLHCIVFEPERRRLLDRVRRSLNAAGEFWVETMCLNDSTPADPAWHLDERGVVWTRTPEDGRCAEAVHRDGAWWMPQRLIARSSDVLLAELQAAGLHVVEFEWYAPSKPGHPGGVRARCSP